MFGDLSRQQDAYYWYIVCTLYSCVYLYLHVVVYNACIIYTVQYLLSHSVLSTCIRILMRSCICVYA